MLPPVLDEFVTNCQIHSYKTTQSDLQGPVCRTELGKMSFKYQCGMQSYYQSVDVNIGIGTFKCHLESHLLSIISWIIIVSTDCVFPMYVFKIYWSTRHDLITGAPYSYAFLSVMGACKHCFSPICHSVLCCICIVYCKAYCGNNCFVLFTKWFKAVLWDT